MVGHLEEDGEYSDRASYDKRVSIPAMTPPPPVRGKKDSHVFTLEVPVDEVCFERIGSAIYPVLARRVEVECLQRPFFAPQCCRVVFLILDLPLDRVAVVGNVELAVGGVVEMRVVGDLDAGMDVDGGLLGSLGAQRVKVREGMPHDRARRALVVPVFLGVASAVDARGDSRD